VSGLTRAGTRSPLTRADAPWLAGAVAGPVLLMLGLAAGTTSSASLLLNLEEVFTVLLAWFVFVKNFDRRVAVGMLFIIAGSVLLSFSSGARFGIDLGVLAIVGACLC
jgi:drug/metabolite transporter (DMT)-like permease